MGPAPSTTTEIYMQVQKRIEIFRALHSPKDWEHFVDDVYSILKGTHLKNFFYHINILHENKNFTMNVMKN